MKRFKPEDFPPRAVAAAVLSKTSVELLLSSFPAFYLSFSVTTADLDLAKGLIREWRFRLNKRLDKTDRTHIIGEAVSGWASFDLYRDHVIVDMLVGLDTRQVPAKHLSIIKRSINAAIGAEPNKIVPVADIDHLIEVQSPVFARDVAALKAESFGIFAKLEA